MLREQHINGDLCLSYVLSEDNPLQQFHVGMLVTNAHLKAVPFHCLYVEGQERLVYKTDQLIPISTAMRGGRGLKLGKALKGLGETLQQLMAHQLCPENMCFEEQFIYVDKAYEQVYLVYLPLKQGIYPAKEALSELLLSWMDQYLLHESQAQPVYIQLLLKLRQENLSFRSLAEALVKPETGPAPIAAAEPEPELEQDLGMGLKLKQETESKPKPKQLLQLKPQPRVKRSAKGLEKMSLQGLKQKHMVAALYGLGPAAALGVLLFGPFEMKTRLGLALIAAAAGLLIAQKLKPLKGFKTEKVHKTNEQTGLQPMTVMKEADHWEAPKHMATVNSQKETWPQATPYAAETVLLRTHAPEAVLMLRAESGPKYYDLKKACTTIGRNPSLCDVLIDETGVGRVHAEVHTTQGKYYIKDSQSLNGTFVNGKRIISNQYHELRSGDLIKIGQSEVVFT